MISSHFLERLLLGLCLMMAHCWAQIRFHEEIALRIRDFSLISPLGKLNTLYRKYGSRKICSTDMIGKVCSEGLFF